MSEATTTAGYSNGFACLPADGRMSKSGCQALKINNSLRLCQPAGARRYWESEWLFTTQALALTWTAFIPIQREARMCADGWIKHGLTSCSLAILTSHSHFPSQDEE